MPSGSLIAQVTPGGTTATAAFTAAIRTEITLINVCAIGAGAAAFSIFHDDAASGTWDGTNALYYAATLADPGTTRIAATAPDGGITVKPTGIIAVQSSVANAITFSFYGQTEQAR